MGWLRKPLFKSMLLIGMALTGVALLAPVWADSGEDGLASPADSNATNSNSTSSSSTSSNSTSRPSHFGESGGPFGDGRMRQGQGPGFRPSSPEEIAAAIEFFNKNSPNRMQYFNALPTDSFMRRRETGRLVQAYRPLQNFKDANPKLYALLVKQVTLRDDAFQLAKDGKDADLRAKAKEIVDVSIQARTIRLSLLQQELDAQRAKLESDKADTDAAAEKEASTITSEEQQLVYRAEHRHGQLHGTSMLNFDPAMDPLAEVAPVAADPPDADACPDEMDPSPKAGS